MTSDGAGDLRLDGLEAGLHRLTMGGEIVAFDVPTWMPNTGPEPRRIVLRHAP